MGAVATEELRDLVRRQDGVVSRTQVLAAGLDSAFIRRMTRRGWWVPVYPGVYLTHTGTPTRRQRSWCAILDAAPAALSHHSAIEAVGTPRDDRARSGEPIHIVVDAGRRVTRRPGVVVHYSSHMAAHVLLHSYPPRVRLEEAVLDVAASAGDELAAIAVLADVVQARLTTADRLLEALERRCRLPRRTFLRGVLEDVRSGACSVLEHRYLTRVERAHGLPTPERQAPTGVGRSGFRDLDYPSLRLVIELDGRLHHDDARARDRDMDRDLDAAAFAERRTLRLGWGQVVVRSCVTAGKVALAMTRRGWSGTPRRCSSNCAIGEVVAAAP
ncbi:type IV toxin-antitoxin system AbiEi family antitoxin domain-containing protein [Gordonia sp. (in: high G+C Gram-positive bacteria)]|uniref:type IV toxin-antitoxin system AbiEi family antitoxin domain-containing protein n=1 Tax=Gordonia sp. (in: high G+C Gram-positive bacteria) TaxID=84139 RepID=UPI0016B95C49|nr:type IV toxin-antitoxin system AbiEi family antitoxin domain-containing protein [Gordonia sp. (in: high G+C Gram-positive bacteria)]NLG46421.1 type IV toxin-antitoxin system AbiEi family antitoxin domain-containing protein [Gordonia sp. (in: high G+C Gram-positive bacteria)]